MSSINNKSPFALEPIEDRIDILFKELELANTWQRPSILLAIYSSEYIHSDASAALENQLIDIGMKAVRIDIKESDSLDLAAIIAAVEEAEKVVFFVDGLRWAAQKDGTNIYRVLNTSRENFITRQIRVVFWLTENEAIDLARYAPDYWAYRHRVVEFIESPEPEQILLRSQASTWQILGEDTDSIEDTDEKIALRRGMLADLPQRTEAMSIRGNLLLSLGILYWRKGALDTSLENLTEALEMAVKISDFRLQAACFNATAIVETELGLFDEAIISYQKTIALAPDQILAWNNLGNLYEKLNRFEDAIEAFEKALEHNPTDALTWNGLGNVYLKLHRNADAVAVYNKSIELDAALAYPWNGLGNAYASQDEFEAAIPAYQKSVELNKDYSIPWMNLGDIYQEQGNNQEALKAYWNAVRIDSKNAQIWNSLGNAYLSAGLCEEAIKSYDKAIRLNRNYEAAYTNLAAAYSLIGKYEESVTFYQKSVELLSGQKQPFARGQVDQTYHQFVVASVDESETDEVEDEVVVREDPVDLQIKAMLQEQETDLAFESETEAECEVDELGEVDLNEESGVFSDPETADQEETDESILGYLDPQVSVDAEASEVVIEAETDCLSAVIVETALPGLVGSAAQETAPDGEPIVDSGETLIAQPELLSDPEAKAELSEQDAPKIVLSAQQVESLVGMEMQACQADDREIESLLNPETAVAVSEAEAGADRLAPTVEVQPENETSSKVEAETVPDPKSIESEISSAALNPRLERMPKDAFVWNELGNIYLSIAEYEDAVAAYKQAIEVDPTLGWGYSNLALAYSLQGRYEDALQAYGKIIYLLTSPEDKVSWRSPSSSQISPDRINALRHAVDSLAVQIEPHGVTYREILVEDIYATHDYLHREIDIDDLALSMREQGVLRPLIVTPNGKPGKFMLVSGMRRLAAARKAGLQTVPVIVREANSREKMELSLVEAALQTNINPLELAETYSKLTEEFHLTHDELAARVGRSSAEIAQTLSLLKLSEKVRLALSAQSLTEGHARALMALSTSLAQDILLKNILEKKLSVLQTEELVHNSVGRKPSFLFAEKEDEALDEDGESIPLSGAVQRKDLKTGDFSLLSRARSVLRSNHQSIYGTEGLSHLAREGEVHE